MEHSPSQKKRYTDSRPLRQPPLERHRSLRRRDRRLWETMRGPRVPGRRGEEVGEFERGEGAIPILMFRGDVSG